MELKHQVVSLEIAKRLKELGVKQESLFYWQEYPEEETRLLYGKSNYASNKNTHTSAYTVAELISMLQTVAKEDIIIAYKDNNIADTLATKLCTKLQNSKENVGSGLTQ